MIVPTLPRYDRSQTYRWNYDHAPETPSAIEVPSLSGNWMFCGRSVASPLGIAAGPLLNGRWILYYAALGFDVLTYKTTRSTKRACYPLPNLLPVDWQALDAADRDVPAAEVMQQSWAVSFGMPSMPPDVWRADVEWTRGRLAKDKLLSVSVVATPEPEWSLDELAADFARCARWAVESGADCVETNFSCPNVASADGQLYQQPEAAAVVAERVRAAIGPASFLIKIGLVRDRELAERLVHALAPHANALAMTNCISAKVSDPGGRFYFDGQPRGIGGEAIRDASVRQVQMFSDLIRKAGYGTRVIGVGGIFTGEHVRQYLGAGAEAVHLATAIMLDPLAGVHIRRDWVG